MAASTRARRDRLIGLAALVVLLAAMVLNTRFLTPKELASALPKPFDPAAVAADLYTKAQAQLPGQAQPVANVVTAIQQDPKAAAARLKAVSPGEGTYVFTVVGTGTVQQATPDLLTLQVPGVPRQTAVLVPLTTAVNGSVLRDAMEFKFADAPGQSAFQFVGDELKRLILADTKKNLPDPASLKGKTVTVVGVTSLIDTGAPPSAAKPFSVQPLTIKVGS